MKIHNETYSSLRASCPPGVRYARISARRRHLFQNILPACDGHVGAPLTDLCGYIGLREYQTHVGMHMSDGGGTVCSCLIHEEYGQSRETIRWPGQSFERPRPGLVFQVSSGYISDHRIRAITPSHHVSRSTRTAGTAMSRRNPGR